MSYQPGEWRPVGELLHRVAPYMSAAGAAKLILAKVAENKDIEAAVVTACYEALRGVTSRNESCTPSPARACEPSRPTNQPTMVDGECREQRIADALRDLDWCGAKLPKADTPEKRAAALVAAFPGVDILAELNKASIWLQDNPRRRKQHLGSFLANWLGRVGRDPGGRRQGNGGQATLALDDDARWLEGCDDV